jgi:2-succinyl-5-enolpyruvyl-6-hydroxy-3-cyclohexene-1-carboxylate synthase
VSGHLLTRWADLLMAHAWRAGVRHVVISPGSRSTAFVLAAHRHEGLRCHDAIDERVAGFFALGIGRRTGQPALLICTSGTAPAHYLPAVIEASVARIPLLVLSADRPLELVDCAAPQTIDQVKLFGDHVRRYADLGLPDAAPAALRGAARRMHQSVLDATWPVAGPVHLNARARKPFEPDGPTTEAERAVDAAVDALLAWSPRIDVPTATPSDAGLDAAAATLAGRRGVILVGPAPIDAAAWRAPAEALARATGFPLLAETVSQLRCYPRADDIVAIDPFDLLLKVGAAREELAPEVVVQLGAPPVAGAIAVWLQGSAPEHIVIADHGWNDWLATATQLLFGDVAAATEALAARCTTPAPPAWSARWRAWRDATESARRHVLDAADHPTEAHAVRALCAALPEGVELLVGNSLGVRLIDWYVDGGGPPRTVLCQRGANGIDGLISAGAGSVAASGQPLVVLLGDVSAVHDLGGLLMARGQDPPLVVVVVDNDGGKIFDILPVARHPGVSPEAMVHLSTPHQVDLSSAASAYGAAYERCLPDDLGQALLRGLQRGGATLLHVPVAPDRAASMLRELIARIGAERPEIADP